VRNHTLAVVYLLLLLIACRRQTTPVVVHIFRDSQGTIGQNLDAAILSVSRQKPTIHNRTLIRVATFEFKTYRDGLRAISSDQKPDIAIFDSRADWEESGIGGAPIDMNCATQVTCVAVIPPWTTGDALSASEQVLHLIRESLHQ
jgi:hypothetical protein